MTWLNGTGSQRFGNIEVGANSVGPTGFTSSTNITLASGGTFYIAGVQTSGGALNCGLGTLNIPTEVSMLVW